MINVPPPEHKLGYPDSQLRRILDEQQYKRLMLWLRGQTVGVIGEGKYREQVVYGHDFRRWVNAEPIIDW